LRARICQHCAPRAVSALTALKARQAILSTGMPHLDELLKGGFRVGTISELVGAAGAGKTQLAMQLCVMAARRGYGTTYIDTEKKLSLERLQEIAHTRAYGEQEEEGGLGYCSGGMQAQQQELQDGYKNPNQVLQNITIHSPSSTNELLAVIQSLEEEILLRNEEAFESSKFPVHLLIVDSIAAPTRRDFGADSAIQRVGLLMEVASVLKRLADQLQLAVVVINQVGAASKASGSSDIYQEVQAALGHSWAHCLSTRVAMEQEASAAVGMCGGAGWRRATIVKSNVAANTSMYYTVANQGLLESESSNQEEQVVPMQ
jgi:RAD51-like protein 1